MAYIDTYTQARACVPQPHRLKWAHSISGKIGWCLEKAEGSGKPGAADRSIVGLELYWSPINLLVSKLACGHRCVRSSMRDE